MFATVLNIVSFGRFTVFVYRLQGDYPARYKVELRAGLLYVCIRYVNSYLQATLLCDDMKDNVRKYIPNDCKFLIDEL